MNRSVLAVAFAILWSGITFVRFSQGAANSNLTIPESEYGALSEFFVRLHGDNWRWRNESIGKKWNFTTGEDPCQNNWQGLTCESVEYDDISQMHVVEISLPAYHLLGTLPESMTMLTMLKSLQLRTNLLNGTLPSSLGQLSHLQHLDLAGNKLTGTLTASLAMLSELVSINLGKNSLAGPLPVLVCQLPKLRDWNSGGNRFTGTIPTCIASVDTLQTLRLPEQVLSGPIPFVLGTMHNLQVLDLSANRLTGTLPIALAGMLSLVSLQLEFNRLEGTIPPEYCSLPQLSVLQLGWNHLNGTLELPWHRLSNLIVLDVFANEFTGTIPASLGAVTTLRFFNASGNQLHGALPASLANLTNLTYLSVESNHLSGTVPTVVCAMTSLVVLNLGTNKFHGDIPDCYGNLSNLHRLYLYENALSATLPTALCRLPSLTHVDLSNSALLGTVPACFGSLGNLQVLNLYQNHLWKRLPEQWGTLFRLNFLDAGGNYFTGPIPAFLLQLPVLEYLYLDTNLLTGPIPPDMNRLASVQELLLESNHLTGTMPPAVGDLRNLRVLGVNYNKLRGSLSHVFQPSQQLRLHTLKLNNNAFSGSLPDEIFLLPALASVIGAVNCFYGTLPTTICKSPTVGTISLDGMGSAKLCRRKILPGLSGAYQMKRAVDQPVPSCLFTMTQLRTLHLSGNSLTGTLPEVNFTGSYINDLSLSHNKLTGPIPAPFQRRPWYSLDLSYNYLSGTLSSDFADEPTPYLEPPPFIDTTQLVQMGWNTSCSLSLENNRLSGRIPSYVRGMNNVSILGSNLFSCDLLKTELPKRDSDREKYDCGSTSFDIPYYAWLILTALCAILLGGAVWWYSDQTVVSVLAAKFNAYMAAVNAQSPNALLNDLVPNTALFSRVCRLLCERAGLCCIYIIAVLMPMYAALSAYHGTLTYQYTYTASMAFLSGPVAMAVLFVALMGLILLFISRIARGLRVYSGVERAIRHSSRYSRSTRKDSRVSHLSVASVPAPVSEVTWQAWWHNTAVYGTFLAVNTLVVVGVNLGYVLVVIYRSSELRLLAAVAVAAFKLLWNGPIAHELIRIAREALIRDVSRTRAAETRFIMAQVLIALLNNVVIPCIIVAVVSPSCLYSILSPPPKVTAPFVYYMCVQYTREKCTTTQPVSTVTVYSPPFQYSYQCSSSMVTSYAPVFATMCIMACFIIPAAHVVGKYYRGRSEDPPLRIRLLFGWVPQILLPLPLTPIVAGRDRFVDLGDLLVSIVTFFALLLTFGAVFPPLAVALTVTLVLVTYYAKLKVGWFLCAAMAAGRLDAVDAVEAECQRAGAVEVLRRSSWLLVALSCAFYTLFLFDTLGDAVGVEHAYWVLIVVPCMPVLFALGGLLYNSCKRRQDPGQEQGQPGVGVEMMDTVTQSIAIGESISIGGEEEEAGSVQNVLHQADATAAQFSVAPP